MSDLTQCRSVLKYPGSKWNLARRLTAFIPEHHSYVEPFFGSGAVFFTKSPSAIETINDIDGNVCNLFSCIQKDPEKLARLVMTTPFARDTYESAFEALRCTDETDETAAYQKALYFLICCWQGHGFRACGNKTGWKNDIHGREKMYALWNWYRLPEWVIECAQRLRRVQIENTCAVTLIRKFNHKDVFMYLDPPYLPEVRSGKQYTHEMSAAQHEVLLKEITGSSAMIMISGYESEMYNDYLYGWHKECFKAYTENGSRRNEVIWTNYAPRRQLTISDIITLPDIFPEASQKGNIADEQTLY